MTNTDTITSLQLTISMPCSDPQRAKDIVEELKTYLHLWSDDFIITSGITTPFNTFTSKSERTSDATPA